MRFLEDHTCTRQPAISGVSGGEDERELRQRGAAGGGHEVLSVADFPPSFCLRLPVEKRVALAFGPGRTATASSPGPRATC
jgi:hypothetical protein